jgi:hypothetical protein
MSFTRTRFSAAAYPNSPNPPSHRRFAGTAAPLPSSLPPASPATTQPRLLARERAPPCVCQRLARTCSAAAPPPPACLSPPVSRALVAGEPRPSPPASPLAVDCLALASNPSSSSCPNPNPRVRVTSFGRSSSRFHHALSSSRGCFASLDFLVRLCRNSFLNPNYLVFRQIRARPAISEISRSMSSPLVTVGSSIRGSFAFSIHIVSHMLAISRISYLLVIYVAYSRSLYSVVAASLSVCRVRSVC